MTSQILSTYLPQIHSALNNFSSFAETEPFHQLALANHCLFVANTVLKNLSVSNVKKTGGVSFTSRHSIGLLAGFLLCVIGGYGGGILNGLLKGNGAVAQFLFGNDEWLTYMFVAWTLVLYAPFNLVHLLTANALFELPSLLLEGYFVSGFLMGAVEDGFKHYGNSHVAPVVFGTIAATGGLWIQPAFINAYLGGTKLMKSLASEPSFFLYVPFLASVYYYLSHCLHYLPERVDLPFKSPHLPIDSVSVKTVVHFVIVAQFAYVWFLFNIFPRIFSPAPRRLSGSSKRADVMDVNTKKSSTSSTTIKNRGRKGKNKKKHH